MIRATTRMELLFIDKIRGVEFAGLYWEHGDTLECFPMVSVVCDIKVAFANREMSYFVRVTLSD